MKKIADWIDLETIVIVFSHLNLEGKIPKKVMDKLLEDENLRNAVGLAAPSSCFDVPCLLKNCT